MSKRALIIGVLLALHAGAGLAQFDQEKLIREYAKQLAKDRDARERASAARWLGGRESPEAVAIGDVANPMPRAAKAAVALSGADSAARRLGSPRRAGRGRGVARVDRSTAGSGAARHGGAAGADLEWDESSFYRALSEADAEAVRADFDGGMSAKHVFMDSSRRMTTPLFCASSLDTFVATTAYACIRRWAIARPSTTKTSPHE